MTHTEHVHILFGIGLAITGALWPRAQVPAAARLRYVWPLWLFAVGFFLVIPTETQEPTYAAGGHGTRRAERGPPGGPGPTSGAPSPRCGSAMRP